MRNIVDRTSLIWLEDTLAAAGIFSFCRDSELDMIRYGYQGDLESLVGDPTITAVVTSWEDAGKMNSVLRRNHAEIVRLFGQDVGIGHEFWPYFLCYLDMGRISSDLPNNFFLSTKIINPPHEVEEPILHLEYDLQITIIKEIASPEEIYKKREDIAEIIRELNARSRYIKIGQVSVGYARSKIILKGQDETEFHPLVY
jgi:hypothetical protein